MVPLPPQLGYPPELRDWANGHANASDVCSQPHLSLRSVDERDIVSGVKGSRRQND